MNHLQGKPEGPAQQPAGQGHVPLFHRPADPGGAHLLSPVGDRGHHVQLHPRLLTEAAQQGRVSPGSFAEAEILSAAEPPGVAGAKQQVPDKGLRFPVPHLPEVQGVQPADSRVLQNPLLVPAGEHGAVSRGAGVKGEHGRLPHLALPSGSAGGVDHRHVAPVQAVEGPQSQGAGGVLLHQLLEGGDDFHGCSSRSKKDLTNFSSPWAGSA